MVVLESQGFQEPFLIFVQKFAVKMSRGDGW